MDIRLKPLTAIRVCLVLSVALIVNALSVLVSAQDGGASSGVTYSGGMSGQAIITVSASVVLLTQMLKWGKIVTDARGPIAVLILALIGVAFWGWSTGDFSRASSFGYFAGWLSVASSAAGVFGFTRAAPEAVTGTSSPPAPPGAGSNTTT